MTAPASYIKALISLHRGLPRQGPGSEALTRRLLQGLEGLPARPVVADMGCGSGAAALVLAQQLQVPVQALDLARPFLVELAAAARARGLAHLIEPVQADMGRPPWPDGTFHLIWSEGAAYSLTFAGALERWRPLLRPGGLLVASEMTWLQDQRPEPVRLFWENSYPQMSDEAGNRAHAAAAGFRVLDTALLPAADWWDSYYTPLKRRIDRLGLLVDAVMEQVILETEVEMELFRQFSGCYGYVFYVLRRED